MKRKQADFQKVKLKVGRRLPKNRNETNTSFQTRKINLREQIKDAPEEVNLQDLLQFIKSSDVSTKHENLRKLRKYVVDKKDALSMFFPDILKELGKTLLESDDVIRFEAVTVIGLCVENLTDTQFKSFVIPLTSYLNCMMTHMSIKVRHDSLKLLDRLLNSHPHIICQSCEICVGLLNMISCKVSQKSTGKRGEKKRDTRKILDVMDSKKTADEWRIDVLDRMHAFLNGMLAEKDSKAIDIDDEKNVYWDAKKPLYLPLYYNSGVKPAELDYSMYSLVHLEGTDSKDFKKLIDELICLLSAMLKGLVGTSTKTVSVSNESTRSIIKDLSIVTQILCCIGEWAIRNSDHGDRLRTAESLKIICNQLLKGFPYSPPASRSTKKNAAECMQLNLGICYLYCMFALLTENTGDVELEELVFSYLGDLLRVCGTMSEECISLTLKISKIVMKCDKFNESYKNGILVGLYGILQMHKILPVADDLYSFFMDLSLNYDFNNLLGCEGMITWFKSLIKDLNFMVESKIVNANYLKYIKQVCARRYPHFMEVLNSLPSEKFIEFLKFGDEEFQLTVIHLIVSLDKISSEFLQDIAETIRDTSFSLKTASRLIRLLHNRFSKPDVKVEPDQRDFVKFLLNVGCDTFLILDPSLDTEPLPFTGFLISFQQCFGCLCEIYPTSDFERHQQLFEVCSDCLPPYLQNEKHIKNTIMFIRAIFADHNKYPVHSVVAFIQLFKRFLVLHNDRESARFLQNFVFSCTLYNSWITNDLPRDYWIPYCVSAVQDCLEITNATDVLFGLNNKVEDFGEDQVYHSLRVLLFLYQKRLFETIDNRLIMQFCHKLKKLDAFHKSHAFGIMLHNICNFCNF